MNTETIRQQLQMRPFTPLEVHMTSSELYTITHPENALLAGTRLFLHDPETDRMAILSLPHIASLAMPQNT